jgi:ribosome-associated protein
MAKRSQANKLQQWIHEALQDAKAQDISMLDVRKISDFTDLMVVASGTSTRHVAAAAERVREVLREHGVRPVGMEGEKIGDWVLIDFGDAVVHIMRPQIRDFYNLEKLWADARPVEADKPKAPRKTMKMPRKKKKASA